MTRREHKARKESRKVARKREMTGAQVLAEIKRATQPRLALVAPVAPAFKSAWPLASLKGESLGDLLRMLSTKRPHKSAMVESFCRDWIDCVRIERICIFAAS